jgi:hypothetical protein
MSWEGRTLILIGTVYVHASAGAPGISRGIGWVQDAEINIGDATVERSFGDGPLEVLDGVVRVGSHSYDNLLPLPFEHVGSIRLELKGAEGGLIAAGSSMRVALRGRAREVEEFEGVGTPEEG